MTVTVPKVSSAVGEITPYAWFRTDLQWHASASRVSRNFIPTPWGPALFRPGLRFVLATKLNNSEPWLVPFRFGYTDGQAYILCFEELLFRVFADKGRVGTVEVATIYAAADLPNLRWTQSADALILVDGAHKLQKITRTAHTSWAIADFELIDGPYFVENTTAVTLTPGGTTGSQTFTASSALFASTDVGRHIRFKASNGSWYWVKITGYTSTTVVTGTIYAAGGTDAGTLPNTNARTTWRLGAYSDTTGWPYAICAHQGRLAIAGQPAGSLPRIDLSNSGDFPNFAPTDGATTPNITDSHAIALIVASGDVNVIFDLESLRELISLTAGKEFRTGVGVTGDVLTPTSAEVRPVTAHGAARVKPAAAYNAVLFVQRDGRTVRELAYAIEADGYRARSLMWRAEHMLKRGLRADGNTVRQLAFQQEPWSALWACDETGNLYSLIYAPDQDLYGWGPHYAAASAAGAAKVRSLACIPYEGADQLWAIVRRTVNGATLYSIEFLERALDWDDRIENAFHLDCGLSLDNTGANIAGGSATLTPGTGATVKGSAGVAMTAGAAVFAGDSTDVGKFILYHYRAPEGDYRADANADPRLAGKVILPGGVDLDTGFVHWLSALAEITAAGTTTSCTAKIWDAFPSLAAIAAADWRLSVMSVSGLSHLEGETVGVVGDGAVQSDKVVASGAITLDSPACTVHVGLRYNGHLVPLLQDTGSRQGTSHGKKVLENKVNLALLKSMGGEIFATGSRFTEEIPYRRAQDLMDLRIPPFTGFTKDIPLGGVSGRDPKIAIKQDLPMPFCLAAIVPHRNVGES